ncbi:MAG: hypothetical protein [Circular genetic element sp.]|nr:MAG: hypothetical protein [Circular genetic element sp.]
MAKRKSRQMKIEPAVQTLSFSMVNNGTNYIDLSRAASAINRRFYRQGLNWAVAGIQFTLVGAGTGSITVSKIPNTWMSANAWKKSFALWNKQQMEALADGGSESAEARFRDFKINLDLSMVNAPVQTAYNTPASGEILRPHDFSAVANLVAEGEWEYSDIVVPNILPDASGSLTQPTEYKLHMVGTNNAGISRGMIEGYADSRAYPQSPDPVSPPVQSSQNWMRDMFDVGNDSGPIIENATDKNDDLPYDQVNYPGGQNNVPGSEIVGYAFLNNGSQTGIGQASVQGSNFPCGLIRLDSGLSGGFVNVQVRLVAGSHRGYLCEPMQEF